MPGTVRFAEAPELVMLVVDVASTHAQGRGVQAAHAQEENIGIKENRREVEDRSSLLYSFEEWLVY